MLEQFLTAFTGQELLFAALVMVLAGTIKGVVGFALPMIAISGIGSFLPAEVAIAAIVLPAFVGNFYQAVNQGLSASLASLREYWRFVGVTAGMIFLSAHLVPYMSPRLIFGILGGVVCVFAVSQLIFGQIVIDRKLARRIEVPAATVSGAIGGIAGVWGPITVMYLLSLRVEKEDMIRVQGVVYFLGSCMLVAAHLNSGILADERLTLSALAVIPMLGGLLLGTAIRQRIDQKLFRRTTLLVLAIAGLNLLRRAYFG